MIVPAASPQAPQLSIQTDFLVIGYGSEQHCDEAVGLKVAHSVKEWQLSSVRSISVSTLSPDLVADIAHARCAIFVNACERDCAQTVQINPIVLSQPYPLSQDPCNPWTLLQLSKSLYDYRPQAWLLQVATACLETRCDVSATAKHGRDRALRVIEQIFRTHRCNSWAKPPQGQYHPTALRTPSPYPSALVVS